MAKTNAPGAMANALALVKRHSIDWQKVAFIVRSLQWWIVKAGHRFDESIANAAWTKAFRVLERVCGENRLYRSEGGKGEQSP